MIYMIYLATEMSGLCESSNLLMPVEGKPMYRHTLDILTIMKEEEPHRYELVVVTDYDEIENAVKNLQVKVVRNEKQELGISHSIRLGIENCGEIGRHDHVMLAVADQPYTQEDELFGFIHMYKRSYMGLGCLKYRQELGTPLIFQGKFVPELLSLSGDEGAEEVLQKHLQEAFLYEADSEKSLLRGL